MCVCVCVGVWVCACLRTGVLLRGVLWDAIYIDFDGARARHLAIDGFE